MEVDYISEGIMCIFKTLVDKMIEENKFNETVEYIPDPPDPILMLRHEFKNGNYFIPILTFRFNWRYFISTNRRVKFYFKPSTGAILAKLETLDYYQGIHKHTVSTSSDDTTKSDYDFEKEEIIKTFKRQGIIYSSKKEEFLKMLYELCAKLKKGETLIYELKSDDLPLEWDYQWEWSAYRFYQFGSIFNDIYKETFGNKNMWVDFYLGGNSTSIVIKVNERCSTKSNKIYFKDVMIFITINKTCINDILPLTEKKFEVLQRNYLMLFGYLPKLGTKKEKFPISRFEAMNSRKKSKLGNRKKQVKMHPTLKGKMYCMQKGKM